MSDAFWGAVIPAPPKYCLSFVERQADLFGLDSRCRPVRTGCQFVFENGAIEAGFDRNLKFRRNSFPPIRSTQEIPPTFEKKPPQCAAPNFGTDLSNGLSVPISIDGLVGERRSTRFEGRKHLQQHLAKCPSQPSPASRYYDRIGLPC
jgi:hypothetical protein